MVLFIGYLLKYFIYSENGWNQIKKNELNALIWLTKSSLSRIHGLLVWVWQDMWNHFLRLIFHSFLLEKTRKIFLDNGAPLKSVTRLFPPLSRVVHDNDSSNALLDGRVRRFQKNGTENRPFGTETEPEPIFFNFLKPEPNRNRPYGTGTGSEPSFFQFFETGTEPEP
jgi:hypothetical protein